MKYLIVAFLLLTSPALAQMQSGQQQPSPELLQRVIGECQAQRNNAMDSLSGLGAQFTMLREENAKLAAEVKALKDKYEPKEPGK